MKLLKNILLVFALLQLATIAPAQQSVFIEGYVTALETGMAVTQKEVTIATDNLTSPLITYTNNNGYFAAQLWVSPGDTISSVFVFVTDCNQQQVLQSFPTDSLTQIRADFQICTLNSGCLALFSYRQDSTNRQLVYFENLSSPVSYSTDWFWDFGDGQMSDAFETSHEYNAPGIYSVCLMMTDSALNCTSQFCMEIWIDSNSGECEAFYTWVGQGLTVAFTDISTGFPDSYLWEFGDGTSSTEQNPIHTFIVPGAYQVCLSIFNDSLQCQSTYCDLIVAGDEPPDCHASYTYNLIEGNTYSFTNESTGMIFEYIWDFGDGTPTSNAANPVHTWQQAGIYNVCLAIVGVLCSDVTCTDITVGDTISACQAEFTVLIDSIPGNINHYWFVDESTGFNISSWYWDFGDGTISFVQYPEYTFSESGTYDVCLTASGQGNGGYCSSTICHTVTTPAYSNLGGQVFAGNFPINNPTNTGDSAIVKLYRKTGNLFSEVASGLFYEYGYYYFLNVMEGHYLVHASLTPGSNASQLYLPGYNGEAQHWQQAQPLSLAGSDVFDANIIMPDSGQHESGPGMISGSLLCIDNSVIELKDRIVFLSRSGNIVAYTYTNENGVFGFSGLPLSGYSLTAEIAGKYSQTIDVNLTELEIQVSGTQIQVASSGVFGIGDEAVPSVNASISIYPNPASEELTINFYAATTGLFNFRIFSATGSQLIEFSANMQQGENALTRNISFLNSGLYLLSVESGEGAQAGKIRFIRQ